MYFTSYKSIKEQIELRDALLVGHETKCERMKEPDESSIIRLYA